MIYVTSFNGRASFILTKAVKSLMIRSSIKALTERDTMPTQIKSYVVKNLSSETD